MQLTSADVDRNKGATYETDRPAADGEREYVMATEYWRTRREANQEQSCTAPVVISQCRAVMLPTQVGPAIYVQEAAQ